MGYKGNTSEGEQSREFSTGERPPLTPPYKGEDNTSAAGDNPVNSSPSLNNVPSGGETSGPAQGGGISSGPLPEQPSSEGSTTSSSSGQPTAQGQPSPQESQGQEGQPDQPDPMQQRAEEARRKRGLLGKTSNDLRHPGDAIVEKAKEKSISWVFDIIAPGTGAMYRGWKWFTGKIF